MNLLHTARAMDSQNFTWRVMAAMIEKAREEFLKTAGTPSHKFATWVLLNPMTEEKTMFAVVAIDDTVAADVVVENNGVNTEAVTDEDILRVVSAEWGNVARKYA